MEKYWDETSRMKGRVSGRDQGVSVSLCYVREDSLTVSLRSKTRTNRTPTWESLGPLLRSSRVRWTVDQHRNGGWSHIPGEMNGTRECESGSGGHHGRVGTWTGRFPWKVHLSKGVNESWMVFTTLFCPTSEVLVCQNNKLYTSLTPVIVIGVDSRVLLTP